MRKNWKMLNKIMGKRKNSISNTFEIDNKTTSDKVFIANSFNEYFVKNPINIQNSIKSTDSSFDHLIRSNQNSMFFHLISNMEIENEIKNIKKNGKLNDVSGKFLKICVSRVTLLLCNLYNNCISQAKFPDCFKLATITPIYKRGSSSLINNHRPVSVLSNLSKIFDGIISKRLRSFFEKHALMNPNQYGFRKNRSTELAVFSMINRITKSFEAKCFSICVFLDFSACFDTISREILLSKLYDYGVRGLPHELIKSYFTDRTQCVEYGETFSCTLPQNIGIIQGSKSGTLYYDIYTSEISNLCPNEEYLMFADDTCLCYSGNNLEALVHHINDRLNIIYDWCASNKLSLNPSKCNYLIFTNRDVKNYPSILLDGVPLKRVHEYKYLGVIIDDKLRYGKHIDHLCGKLSRLCGMSFRLKHHLNVKSAKNIYYSCVYSSIKYCIGIYGGILQCNQTGNRLKSLQKRIVRNLFGVFERQDTNLFKKYEILRIEDIHRLTLAIYMYKIIMLNECPTLKDCLDLAYPEHQHSTRNKDKLILPFPRVENLRSNFKYQCPDIWNNIPEHIKNAKTVQSFKKSLISQMLNMY